MSAKLLATLVVLIPLLTCKLVESGDKITAESNEAIDWELVPAGYLEPLLRGSSFAEVVDKYTTKDLQELIHDRDKFVFAYIILRKKQGHEVAIPADRSIEKCEGTFGLLNVRVIYGVKNRDIVKRIEYPDIDYQFQRIRDTVKASPGSKNPLAVGNRRWHGGENTLAIYEVPDVSHLSEKIEAILDPSTSIAVDVYNFNRMICVSPEAQGVSNDLYAKDLQKLRSLLNEDRFLPTLHIALSEKLFPLQQHARGVATGFVVNVNGLTVELRTDKTGERRVVFSALESERHEIRSFWEKRMLWSKRDDSDSPNPDSR
jgi:hypothetical protein